MWEAITTLVKGIIVVIGITALLTFIVPGVTITSEMMARSAPSLFDLLVAFSCGFIGAFAYINKKVFTTIPGVAISVALMPPVCTAGIGIGLGNWDLAKGATLLFLANLFGIILTSLITFYLVRLNPKSEDKREMMKVKRRVFSHMAVTTLIVVLISIPLIYFMKNSITRSSRENKVNEALIEVLSEDDIIDSDYYWGTTNRIRLILTDSDSVNREILRQLEETLTERLSQTTVIESYIIPVMTAQDYAIQPAELITNQVLDQT